MCIRDRPIFIASSGVSSAFATPLAPSVPNNLPIIYAVSYTHLNVNGIAVTGISEYIISPPV